MSKTLFWKLASWTLPIFLILAPIPFTTSTVEACQHRIEDFKIVSAPPFTEGDIICFHATIFNDYEYTDTLNVKLYFDNDKTEWESHSIKLVPNESWEFKSYSWPATAGGHTATLVAGCASASYDFCVRPSEEYETYLAMSKGFTAKGVPYLSGGKGFNKDRNDWATDDDLSAGYNDPINGPNALGLDCSGFIMWAFDSAFKCGRCLRNCKNCSSEEQTPPQCKCYPTYNPGSPEKENTCDEYTPIKQQDTTQQWKSDKHIYHYYCFNTKVAEGAVTQFKNKLFPEGKDKINYDLRNIEIDKGIKLQRGDLIYFFGPNKIITSEPHVVMYIGGGLVIHSRDKRKIKLNPVRYDDPGVHIDTLYSCLRIYSKINGEPNDWFNYVGIGRFSWNFKNNPKCPSTSAAQISDQTKTATTYSLQYDESPGAVVGAYVNGDRGHIVYFTPPTEPYTIKKIGMFAAAKIKNTSELKNVITIRIWDKDGNNQLWSTDVPWSTFLDGTWQDIKVPDVTVNDDFLVEVVTHSQAQGDPIDFVSMTGIIPALSDPEANLFRITGPVQGSVQSAVLIGFDYPKSYLESPSAQNRPETRSGYSYMGKSIDPGQGRLQGINWLIRVEGEGEPGS